MASAPAAAATTAASVPIATTNPSLAAKVRAAPARAPCGLPDDRVYEFARLHAANVMKSGRHAALLARRYQEAGMLPEALHPRKAGQRLQ